MSERFIGRGWAFPLRVGPTGGIAMVEREREIEEAIRLILGTAPGERPMRPEFGCGIHEYVFAPGDGATAGRIAQQVREALERWEPRIAVDEVVVAFDLIETGTLYIDVRYTVRSTNDRRNLVFPFYSIPSDGAADPDGAGGPDPDGGGAGAGAGSGPSGGGPSGGGPYGAGAAQGPYGRGLPGRGAR
jgi:uncharacterized protein